MSVKRVFQKIDHHDDWRERKIMTRFFLTVLALLLSGCMTHMTHANLKMASSGPQEKVDGLVNRLSEDLVKGRNCKTWILFFPVGTERIDDEAWEKALDQIPGTEALTEVEVKQKWDLVTVFYNRICAEVSGFPVVFR